MTFEELESLNLTEEEFVRRLKLFQQTVFEKRIRLAQDNWPEEKIRKLFEIRTTSDGRLVFDTLDFEMALRIKTMATIIEKRRT